MTKVLVLGANGFIGKHLSERLSALPGVELTLFSRTISDHLRQITQNNANYISGDFSDSLLISSILKNQDIVYHLISSSFPSNSWKHPIIDVTENLVPSIKLFELCAEACIKRVIFLSSGGTVYGRKERRLTEEDSLEPFSPYGIVKASLEHFLRYYEVKSDLKYDIYRVSNAYGPYLNKIGFGVINTWLKAALDEKEILLMGDGSVQKDYIYVGDVITMLLNSLALKSTDSEIYNACSGSVHSLNDILSAISTITNRRLNIKRVKSHSSDNRVVKLNNSKITKLLNLKSLIPLEEGIRRTWTYYTQAK